MMDMMATKKEMIAMLLAGGQGNRLHVLTRERAKPAVPSAASTGLLISPSPTARIRG
jgi:ADP-glucose pyrophosphorylase